MHIYVGVGVKLFIIVIGMLNFTIITESDREIVHKFTYYVVWVRNLCRIYLKSGWDCAHLPFVLWFWLAENFNVVVDAWKIHTPLSLF